MVHNKVEANDCERFVARELVSLGLHAQHLGGSSEHDLIVNGATSVEIKSARLIEYTGKRKGQKLAGFGRFDLRQKTQREKLSEQNRWICFVVTCARKHHIMAFVPAQCLKLNARHITLASLLDNEGAVNIEEFVEAVVKA
jgi:hypothetical protein